MKAVDSSVAVAAIASRLPDAHGPPTVVNSSHSTMQVSQCSHCWFGGRLVHADADTLTGIG